MNIYVSNLSYWVTEQNLKEAFGAFGEIETARVIKDSFTGRPKGFGFVEMPDSVKAESAIEGLNGKELKGQMIKVTKARPRPEGRRARGNTERKRQDRGRRFY